MSWTRPGTRQLDLDSLVDKAQHLLTFSPAAAKALQLLADDTADVERIAREILRDQGLTARVLKIANSPLYGFRARISTVRHAIVVIGLRQTKSLLFMAAASNALSTDLPGYRLEAGEVFAHALAVGTLAKQLAERSAHPNPEESMIAGLLHDIGKLALNALVENAGREIEELVAIDGVPLMLAERMAVGADHTQVGQRIAERWNLPASLAAAIRFHHEPHLDESSSPDTPVVHVANAICLAAGLGALPGMAKTAVNAECLAALRLSNDDLARLTATVQHDRGLYMAHAQQEG